jgi:hypothetical protein
MCSLNEQVESDGSRKHLIKNSKRRTILKTVIVFKLERPARKSGGDRYESQGVIADYQIYVPQQISRPAGGKPVNLITLTFESEEN